MPKAVGIVRIEEGLEPWHLMIQRKKYAETALGKQVTSKRGASFKVFSSQAIHKQNTRKTPLIGFSKLRSC